jgi:23S rRNA (guanosine2251-2'-O)-methyltransferase
VAVWGVHPVDEFLKVRPDAVEGLFVLPSFGRKKAQAQLLDIAAVRGISARRVSDFAVLGMPGTASHQGVAAWVRPVWSLDFSTISGCWGDRTPLLVVCDLVTDPQNLGAIIRSAAAFGAQAVVLPQRGAAPITGVVAKASSGTLAHIKVCYIGNVVKTLLQIQEMGLWAVGLSPEGDQPLWGVDLTGPVALVAGAEGAGLRHLVKNGCDFLVSIPHAKGVGSVNVASAAGIALYEVARQRSLSAGLAA